MSKKLTPEELVNLIKKNPFNFGRMIKSSNREFYDFINVNFKGSRFPEKLYRYINIDNKNLGICPNCGKDCKFIHINKGFSYRCSYTCHNRAAQQSKEKTTMEKYGVKNISQAQEIKNKKKETYLSHFGVDCNLKLESTKEQIKQTNLKKYGTEHPNQSPVIIKRNLEILYERFLTDDRYKEVVPLFTKEEYCGVELEHKWKCKLCNHEFDSHLQDGRIPRCYTCYPPSTSLAQSEIQEFIKSLSIDIVINDRKVLNGKELDIYMPSKNLAIEFNGLYYHGEISGGISKQYHLNKTLECACKGIQLIHIFEDEWNSKKDIVKSRLKSLLHKSTNVIYARKCEVRIIPSKECSVFLDINHIQGKDLSNIKLGLYYNNELVSTMTFGGLRKCMGSKSLEDNYELYRFCSKLNYSVVGAAGKLYAHFVKLYMPKRVISYADRRWSVGNLYEKIGFKKLSTSSPNYFYMKDHTKRLYRFNFRKSELHKKLKTFNPDISEWENMKLNGYDRIWDCGTIKFEWEIIPNKLP